MKFKVGDRVRFVKSNMYHTRAVKLGGIYTVKTVENKTKQYLVNCENKHGEYFYEEELALAEYTYKDLEKASIGTKVTFEDGDVLIKTKKNYYENNKYYRDNTDLKGLKDNCGECLLGKIIKIEETEYQTVYESKPEILDEVEKRYLSNVIRPFRGNVRFITKRRYWIDSTEYNDISICINNNSNIILPKFKANNMYKGMEIEKTYTLEELGL